MTHHASPLARVIAALRCGLVRHPDRAALLLILFSALAIRLVFAFRAPVFLAHDSVTYFQAGYDLARGSSFDLAFKRTPLYPLFIAGVVWLVSEDLQALAFVQHLLGATTAALTYFLGRAIFGRLAGLVAGLAVAMSGPLIIYEHYILAEAIFIPLLVAFGLALVRAIKAERERPTGNLPPRSVLAWLILAGVLLGLASLARPVGQAILLVLPLAIFLALGSWRRTGLATLAVGLGFAALMLPWMTRNYLQNGSFESAGAVGQTLTGRITRHDEGFVLPAPDSPSPYSDPVQTEARALILRQMAREARPSAINHRLRQTYGWTESQANRAMRDVCLQILVEQKERYIWSTLVKTRRLLWGEPDDFFGVHWGNRKSNELRENWVSNSSIAHLLTPVSPLQEAEKFNAERIATFFSPGHLRWPLLLLLLAGLLAGVRSKQGWSMAFIVLLVLALVFPAAALVGFVPRYRYPTDPYLAVLVGGGVAWLAHLLARAAESASRSYRVKARSGEPRTAVSSGERPATEPAG